VPYGAIATICEEEGSIGVLHVDAHHDLRVAYQDFTWSHASIMHNVLEGLPQVQRLVQVGIRDAGAAEAVRAAEDPRIYVHYDANDYPAWEDVIAPLPPVVWVSFDVDGLDPSLCPNTGTPVPGGLGWREAMALLRALGRSGRRVAGFDVNEVAPGPEAGEGGDGWDSNVGARLVYKLCGWTLATRDHAPRPDIRERAM
jgi:agmatinase